MELWFAGVINWVTAVLREKTAEFCSGHSLWDEGLGLPLAEAPQLSGPFGNCVTLPFRADQSNDPPAECEGTVPWLQLAPYWRTTPASKLRKPASPFAQSRCYPFSSRETDSKCTDKLINYSSCSSLFPKKRNLRLSCTVLYLCVYLYLFAWWPQVPTTAVIADFSSFYTSETPF